MGADDLGEHGELTPCPKCGSVDGFYVGYGLMGGGIGAYEGCDDCEYFSKTQDKEAR